MLKMHLKATGQAIAAVAGVFLVLTLGKTLYDGMEVPPITEPLSAEQDDQWVREIVGDGGEHVIARRPATAAECSNGGVMFEVWRNRALDEIRISCNGQDGMHGKDVTGYERRSQPENEPTSQEGRSLSEIMDDGEGDLNEDGIQYIPRMANPDECQNGGIVYGIWLNHVLINEIVAKCTAIDDPFEYYVDKGYVWMKRRPTSDVVYLLKDGELIPEEGPFPPPPGSANPPIASPYDR